MKDDYTVTDMNWREHWEEKDVCGNTVTEVVLWGSGTPACYRYEIGGYGAASPTVMRDSFVMHQPDVKTADCPPCGKVVRK